MTIGVVALAGVIVGASGFVEAWAQFDWVSALKTFMSLMTLASMLALFAVIVWRDNDNIKWWLLGGLTFVTVVFGSMCAGLPG